MEENEKMKNEAESVETVPVAESVPAAGADNGDKKKPLTKKQKVVNGILLGLQIALVVFAIALTLVMLLNPKKDDVTGVGIKLLPVLSDSMDGTRTIDGVEYKGFPTGSLVIAKSSKNVDLKVGDIVTFQDRIGDEIRLNTHRIVEVVEIEPGVVKYRTQGDNPAAPVDSTLKLPGDIKAVYITHIKGVGYALNWIRDGYHFIFVIIIPLGVLLIYNIYLVAQIVVEGKMKKAKAAAAASAAEAALASIDEEEIKRRAIEEYLRNQANAAESKDSEDKGDA